MNAIKALGKNHDAKRNPVVIKPGTNTHIFCRSDFLCIIQYLKGCRSGGELHQNGSEATLISFLNLVASEGMRVMDYLF